MTGADLPFFGPEHQQLSELLASRVAPQIELLAEPPAADEDTRARAMLAALARTGVLAHAVPPQAGSPDGTSAPSAGLPAVAGIVEDDSRPRATSEGVVGDEPRGRIDLRGLCLIRERLAEISGLADVMFAMQGLGSYPIALAGSRALRQRYLPAAAAGNAIAAFALTEPQAGSDVASIETTARRDGDQYVLDGVKTFISNAGLADFYVVFAKTDVAAGKKGLSAIVVDAASRGCVVRERLEAMAPHPLGTIEFRACRVPAGQRLAAEGEGLKIALATLSVFRTSVGAAALGMGDRALREAVAYARERRQFGSALATYQATQLKLADAATELDAARLLIYRAAWLHDTSPAARRITVEASMAKLFATEAAQRAIDAAVQIHGGRGVIRGAVVERLYREIRALRIYEGTSEIQRFVIAGELLKEHSDNPES